MKKLIILLFFICCQIIFSSQTSTTNDKGILLLKEAKQLIVSKDPQKVEKAKRDLETIIYDYRKSKALEEALYLLGTYHLKNDNDIDGQLYLKKLLKKFPTSKKAYEVNYLLYKSYEKMHNKFQKNIYLKKLYLLNPNGKYTKNILPDLIKLAVKEENYKIGKDYIEKAVELGVDAIEKDPVALFAAGEIYFKRKNIKKAMIYFEKLLSLYSTHFIASLGKERLAECYIINKDIERAEKLLLEVFLNYKETDAYAMAIIKLTELITSKQIEEIQIEGQQFDPEKLLQNIIDNKIKYSKAILPLALKTKANYYFFKGKESEGILLLKQLILKYPNAKFTELNREIFYKKLKKYVKEQFKKKNYINIISICENVKTLIPNNYDIIKTLGDSYQAIGATNKAEQVYKKLIVESGEKNLVKDSLFKQAELDYKERRYKSAGRAYQLFIANFKNSKEYNLSIARIIEILTILQKYDKAIDFYNKNKQFLNTDALKLDTYYFLAKAYTKLEKPNPEKAAYYYKKFIELKPDNKTKLFQAKLFVLNREIINGTATNVINKLNNLLKIQEDSFVRLLKIKEFLKQDKLKKAKEELKNIKEDDYFSQIAKDYVNTYEKTGLLIEYKKIGNKIFKTPFD